MATQQATIVEDDLFGFNHKLRARFAERLLVAKKQITMGSIPPLISDHLTDEYVSELCEEHSLPPTVGPWLRAIVQFLYNEDQEPTQALPPREIRKNLKSIEKRAVQLRQQLSELPEAVRMRLNRVIEVQDGDEEPVLVLDTPPIGETIQALDEIIPWLDSNYIELGKSGNPPSAKRFAIVMLRRILNQHRPNYSRNDLVQLANSVLDPVLDQHGEAEDCADLAGEIMKTSPAALGNF